jgi:hypothetical protein
MLASSATPITVVHGTVSLPMRKHSPIASRPGQSARAIPSLTTATSGVSSRSFASKGRPRRIRVPDAAK